MAATALNTFLHGLVDYAGLFPPSQLPMEKAVAEFARLKKSSHAAGVARFIVPLSRLDEWSEAARPYLLNGCVPDNQPAPAPWGLSVLLDGPLEEGLRQIERFNRSHEAGDGHTHKHAHTAVIDTIEVKIQTPEIIDVAQEKLPEDLFPFFEVPVDGDFRSFATALAGTGFGAKLRTGGVTPELFPSTERVAEFLITFNAADVPIKCTAGLHHPVRSVQKLTYKPDSPSHMMHGFLNVFFAAAFVRAANADKETILRILNETSPNAFRFEEGAIAWRDLRLTTHQLEEAREDFAICFGSCSFDEPIEDLKKLGYMV
ncbi:MAG TPA: hypothetical protein VEB22_09715 [Phycisphaerales bacterium]|nr:hypothetical protein [Phycisphaerales bacterium]